MIRTTARAVGLLVCGWVCAANASEIPKPEHPTPDAVRAHWSNLNGPWEFRFDALDEGRKAGWSAPEAEGFDRTIVVPFGWESELSGINKVRAPKVGWYRRSFRVPEDFPKGDRVWLRFGAVDWQADVWVNGKPVASHEGGYTPFEADVTEALRPGESNLVTVRAYDPTDPQLPTGKQVNWYTPTSGIWQTVWLESRPKAHIAGFAVQTTINPAAAGIVVTAAGLGDGAYTLTVRSVDPTVQPASVSFEKGQADGGRVALTVPVAEPKLWTPETPHLYDVALELKGPDGTVDTVRTYFGLRTIARGRLGNEPFERILLNGKPLYLRAALDQSFNPKGIYTTPDDAFMRRDLELAKSFNLNALRIHIKPDEPRRLYWADKLGVLILEDMPNTWRQSAPARAAWERTMREVVARDRNHPSIIAWIDFNETWGLGRPEQFKVRRDTQAWVQAMMAETRKLDPTRLVEDNSPCNYDHVEGTDLNSWHFYIDDHEEASQHIADVVAKTHPGSGFNYVPGQVQGTAPLINSEYGSVSAGGGDRDVSWGFRDLTTLLRKYPQIQGYVYTELSDIEWEHNGFLDYDRSPKEFGYDAFVPGMTVADLQGPDFIGYDAPPAIVARPGERIRVPLFVSHYSDRREAPTLTWWLSGVDERGEPVKFEARRSPVAWTPYGVAPVAPAEFQVDRTFVGALALTLDDASGHRIAANFVNLVVAPETSRPRVERRDDHAAVVRFTPSDFARSRWSEGVANQPRRIVKLADKAFGGGKGLLEYRLKLPEAVAKAGPKSVELLVEASAKAGRERVDWPERINAYDNPQTDATKWPSTLEVGINGQKIARVTLSDDPADARGVLSHLARAHHGSYGDLIRVQADLPEPVRADLAAGKPLILTLAVPDDAEHPGGLALYGSETGRYPFDPTLTVHTERDLPADLGVRPDMPVAIETALARRTHLIPASLKWAYTTANPGPSWEAPGFDDQSWPRGDAGFGTGETPSLRVGTPWETPALWLRSRVDLPRFRASDALTLHLFHDEDVEIYVNGKRLLRSRGYQTSYLDIPLDEGQRALFRPGTNVIALTCRQTEGGQGVDLGLSLTPNE